MDIYEMRLLTGMGWYIKYIPFALYYKKSLKWVKQFDKCVLQQADTSRLETLTIAKTCFTSEREQLLDTPTNAYRIKILTKIIDYIEKELQRYE